MIAVVDDDVSVRSATAGLLRAHGFIAKADSAESFDQDPLRNGRGASTVAPFSVRARPGLAMSMAVSWVELADVKRGDQWSMAAAIERQRTYRSDPWEGYWKVRQRITAAMRRSVGMAR